MGSEWNNAAYEITRKKEKSYRFAHPAQGSTHSYPYFNQREGMGTSEKKELHTGSKKKIRTNKKKLN